MPPAYVDEKQMQNQNATKGVRTATVEKWEFTSKVEDILDSDQPPRPKLQSSAVDPTGEPTDSAYAKLDFRKLTTEFPEAHQASIGSAFQLAAESYFKGGAFEKAMSDTVHRVATIQTTYRYGRDKEESNSDDEKPAVAMPCKSSATGLDIAHSKSKGRRASQSRICHRTSATGTLFGTIWLRTTSVQISASTCKNVDIVSSFTFFPSWWLTKVGMKYGMEANLFTTPTGWQFNFNPVRAVPDDSPIFNACQKGNIETVRFLLTEGEASVRDTNSKGWTPLHVSRSPVVLLDRPKMTSCAGTFSHWHSLQRWPSRRATLTSANS